MASQVTSYEFAKDNFKDTSSDLEDSLAEVEKICCGFTLGKNAKSSKTKSVRNQKQKKFK